MMNAIGKYIISIVCASAVCGMLTSLASHKASGGIIRVLAGIFMALTVISPLAGIQLDALESYLSSIQIDAEDASQEGLSAASEETAAIIKQELEAYIIEKADSLHVTVSVQITLTDDFPPQPYEVTLSGSVSPYNKKVLTDYIANELGIPEERQTWK